ACLAAVKTVFLLFPARFPLAEQDAAFYWTTIAVISLMGLAGLMLSRKTGFPEMWDARVTNRQRFLVPALVGLVYGVVTVLKDLPNPEPVHLKLPHSIAFYTYGAIFLEIMLRLFAVPFVVWLVSNLALRGRGQTQAFWLAAVVAALYEPLPHINEELARASNVAVPAVLAGWALQPLFLANVAAAYLFRRYGFLAPLVMRLAFYLVWHVLYGGLR
ncbi:MAG TPA: hypothetical protein VGV38_24025, partial [Pyrinomonadaceae bacterium]|nr:hypothetical protein [Pyrinomonadaceae bacterium]